MSASEWISSRAGFARPKKYPCTSVQPAASAAASWASRLDALGRRGHAEAVAEAGIDRTIADALRASPRSRTKDWSILILSKGNCCR